MPRDEDEFGAVHVNFEVIVTYLKAKLYGNYLDKSILLGQKRKCLRDLRISQ